MVRDTEKGGDEQAVWCLESPWYVEKHRTPRKPNQKLCGVVDRKYVWTGNTLLLGINCY